MTREGKWSVSLHDFVAKAKADVEQVARVATFHLFQSVVNLSPVDSGRFRANWNMSYTTPDFGTSGSVDEGRGDAEAAKALSFTIGDIAYLCNGLPYARRLEYGYSKQAPMGMVRLSVVDFRQYLVDAIKDGK